MATLYGLDSTTPEITVTTGAAPTLSLKQAGTGPALKGTSTGTGAAVEAYASPTAGASIPALRIYASVASQAAIELYGVFASTASLNVAAAGVVFAIPVRHGTQNINGWIPVLARP